jgi:hypothetical protein
MRYLRSVVRQRERRRGALCFQNENHSVFWNWVPGQKDNTIADPRVGRAGTKIRNEASTTPRMTQPYFFLRATAPERCENMNGHKLMLKIAFGLMVGGVAAMALLFTTLGPLGPCLTESQTFAIGFGFISFGSGILVSALAGFRWIMRRSRRRTDRA